MPLTSSKGSLKVSSLAGLMNMEKMSSWIDDVTGPVPLLTRRCVQLPQRRDEQLAMDARHATTKGEFARTVWDPLHSRAKTLAASSETESGESCCKAGVPLHMSVNNNSACRFTWIAKRMASSTRSLFVILFHALCKRLCSFLTLITFLEFTLIR